MTGKQVWILTGGNGAGKSTFYRLMLESRGLIFINADRIARSLDPDYPEKKSYEAALAAMSLFRKFINEGKSFCYETVFSHKSKVEFVEIAKTAGYAVILVYIHLVKDLHGLRVIQRVSEGGHSVPQEKIVPRLRRTLEHMKLAAPMADEVLLFDNSSDTNPFELVARSRDDHIDVFVESLPDWAQSILFDRMGST